LSAHASKKNCKTRPGPAREALIDSRAKVRQRGGKRIKGPGTRCRKTEVLVGKGHDEGYLGGREMKAGCYGVSNFQTVLIKSEKQRRMVGTWILKQDARSGAMKKPLKHNSPSLHRRRIGRGEESYTANSLALTQREMGGRAKTEGAYFIAKFVLRHRGNKLSEGRPARTGKISKTK